LPTFLSALQSPLLVPCSLAAHPSPKETCFQRDQPFFSWHSPKEGSSYHMLGFNYHLYICLTGQYNNH
jgi:hypothetical protein